MFNKARVIKLATNEPTYVHLAHKEMLYMSEEPFVQQDKLHYTSYHLYLITEEQVNDGDYCIITNNVNTNFLCQFRDNKYHFVTAHGHGGYTTIVTGSVYKVIATTNKSLYYLHEEELLIGKKLVILSGSNPVPGISRKFIRIYCEEEVEDVLVEYGYMDLDKLNLRDNVSYLKIDLDNDVNIRLPKVTWNASEVKALLENYREVVWRFGASSMVLEDWMENNVN